MSGTATTVPRIITITIALANLFRIAAARAADQNLITNPGFEIGGGSTPDSWSFGNGAAGNTFDWLTNDWLSDDVHSDNRSLRMNSTNAPAAEHSMSVTCNLFEAPPHSRVGASVWMKASNIVSQGDLEWYGLRVTLTAYGASGVKIEHRDLVNEKGSFSWKRIQGGMLVPEGTAAMDLSIKMTTCTGTVWIDDAEVKVVEKLPTLDLTGIRNPVLIPRPWQVKLSGDKFELRHVAITNYCEDARIREAADSLFTSLGIAHEFLTQDSPKSGRYSTQFILGDGANPALHKEFWLRFPEYDWPDLGDQGYFLAVTRQEGQDRIYAGANSHIGRFYAIQTLRQLIRDKQVYVADILDRPTIGRRGIPMGLQWFEERNQEALKRLTQLKYNFVWAQGSFLQDCLGTDNWRRDFTFSQKVLLEQFIKLYEKNFIEVWMGIGPRGKNPPLQYSSDADIDTIVKKMDVLYSLGLRNFGLRFDDLMNVGEDKLLVQEDIDFFKGDIGAAQVYLVNAVYGRLKALHPDIKFMVVPMDYNQNGNYGDAAKASLRLRQFYNLPAEIRVYTVSYYDEDILATACLTGRPSVTIESNFYAESSGAFPEYVVPYMSFINWQNTVVRARIAGFTWLPKTLESEDAALVSWHTAADFAWAPERYDPNQSFQLAAARYLGVPDGIPVTNDSATGPR